MEGEGMKTTKKVTLTESESGVWFTLGDTEPYLFTGACIKRQSIGGCGRTLIVQGGQVRLDIDDDIIRAIGRQLPKEEMQ